MNTGQESIQLKLKVEVTAMALVRCVTEMGMGVDVHGLDYTNAAKRAVFDAIHHSSLGFPRLVGKTADDICGWM